jgi:signal transduction histidine kinase
MASFRSGLIRIDDPTAERPRFVTYTTADGLSSNEIAAVCEDRWGRIYVGTGRGIDRLDLQTGRVKHYTTADGFPLGLMQGALRDHTGALWFSFQAGIARLVPESEPPPVLPPVLITGLRIAGQPHEVSALGETEIASLELGSDNNQLQIDFVALGFSPGEGLRYQYQLVDASEEWSELSDQRTVNFAHLAPGRYRFLVRAVNADGVMSQSPAGFSFRVLPPLWQRWWFMAIATALVGLVVYALYRYRVRRLIEIERVRTRIATDLHDDIGSSLSQIAIMSEVARQQVDGENQRVSHPLSVIAGTSRELVDSMADIVWAINPQRDHLIDLTQRMRQFAADLLTARNIEFRFAAPGPEHDVPLETDIRREVFLIFKEAVNNAVRHSNCSFIEIGFSVNDKALMLKVTDNGSGFDPLLAGSGHGLTSMKRRAKSIGGTLETVPEAGRGTTVTLQAPLRHRRLSSMKITT